MFSWSHQKPAKPLFDLCSLGLASELQTPNSLPFLISAWMFDRQPALLGPSTGENQPENLFFFFFLLRLPPAPAPSVCISSMIGNITHSCQHLATWNGSGSCLFGSCSVCVSCLGPFLPGIHGILGQKQPCVLLSHEQVLSGSEDTVRDGPHHQVLEYLGLSPACCLLLIMLAPGGNK